MKYILKFLFLLFVTFLHAQKDISSENITDIDAVIINDKDYEKVEYFYGLNQENNVRYIPMAYREEGIVFRNNLGKKGRINNVIIFFHKTDSKVNLTNVEINFYKIDSLTGKPGEKINSKQIIYSPKNKSRGKIKINVSDYHIPFLLEGIFVALKWLPNQFNDRKVGPSLRETDYYDQITYTRFKDGNWSKIINISKRQNMYTNAMIGLEVYVKRKKNNE